MSNSLKTEKIRNATTDASTFETNSFFDELDSKTQDGGFIPEPDTFKYHVKKGKALIISLNYFGRTIERKGNIYDRKRLESLCQKMGFETKLLEDYIDPTTNIYQGLSKAKITEEIKKWSKNEKDILKDTDCLILAVMAHGFVDKKGESIVTTDGNSIELQWITKMFANNRCTALAGKPKIFILQHCRGGNLDFGIKIKRPLSVQADGIANTKENQTSIIPNMSEFIIFQACYEGFEAYLTERGSTFIQSLVDKFEEELPQKRELHHIMLKINRRNANYSFAPNKLFLNEGETENVVKEASCFKSTSTREIYLPWTATQATNNN